ncbi:secreted RxLR effector peptide protein, putative [Phytophthora infestans T30-4]|uniref:Secreted RxLR effector peptide protein, putative n=1 Tax=Phytophthora infestans (strain T30-4) TaxID=403677 RepID=D0NTJ2_PHYIT|nr:secreted RxLR effector peptide protein, putative [Phytophthora infestans T30-4]EEY64943.1 secreted RxLR effector peptide protein, putative [Phytophthora infestans T30-4]|eukprot:XP_002897673.1 secreted RxLR effector peptide protein, putative [Phytophthora infestans T30-4]
MRWLIRIALSTLVMHQASTKALPTDEIATKNSKLDAVSSVRVISTLHDVSGNRSLRGASNKVTAQHEDEERNSLRSFANKLVTFTFKWMYKKGETPVSLRAKMMGKNSFLFHEYKLWFAAVRATGKMPKWSYSGQHK